ncbi:hypothetical protein E9993_18950 [Labilibacter sediminis]|nr:hypothetical protein E9993_18950 [Labilibacter sediminis]
MKNKLVTTYFIFSAFLLLGGCVKEDLNKLTDRYSWTPNFSLPVATITMDSDDYDDPGLSFLEQYERSQKVLLEDTIKFNFTDIFEEEEFVEQLMFRFNIENRFPSKIEVDAYYLDENENSLGAVITDAPLIIPAPVVNEEGEVVRTYNIIHDEYVLSEDVPSLVDVKYILIYVTIIELDTRPEVTSQIDDYDIEIGVGIRAYLNVPVNE